MCMYVCVFLHVRVCVCVETQRLNRCEKLVEFGIILQDNTCSSGGQHVIIILNTKFYYKLLVNQLVENIISINLNNLSKSMCTDAKYASE